MLVLTFSDEVCHIRRRATYEAHKETVLADRTHMGSYSVFPGEPYSDMALESALDTRVHVVPSGMYFLYLHDHGMLTIVDI